MADVDRKLLAAAAELLASTEDAQELFDALEAVVRLAQVNRLPIALTANAEPLNVLVELARQNREAYERVLDLVDKRRANTGFRPLRPEPNESFDKRAYMRQFMDRKRQRLNRAVELENLNRPERDKLRGTARMEFCDAQAAKWKVELDKRMERARMAAEGALSKDVTATLREQFWTWVDTQLDEAEAKARYPKK